MTHSSEYGPENYISPEAEITGIEMADRLASELTGVSGVDDPRLSVDERLDLQELLAPGFAHFYSLARRAGELWEQGDLGGALEMMGGVERARELVGDETVDELLAEISDRAADASSPDTLPLQ